MRAGKAEYTTKGHRGELLSSASCVVLPRLICAIFMLINNLSLLTTWSVFYFRTEQHVLLPSDLLVSDSGSFTSYIYELFVVHNLGINKKKNTLHCR